MEEQLPPALPLKEIAQSVKTTPPKDFCFDVV
jgi:hypothetical protein